MKNILILFLLTLCTCTKAKDPKATLRLAFHSYPQTFDPRKSADFLSSTLVCLIYEGLTRCSPDGGVEPALAEKWTISPDGLVYTFTLRKSIWSHHQAVTAYDFERSWKDILNPSFHSPSSYLLFPIKNGEKFAKGEGDPSQVGVEALDDSTLVVTLERPTPYFLSLTAFPLFLPAPNVGVGKIANGPFCIAKSRLDDAIFLVKNETYWRSKTIHLDAIKIQIIPDENTALSMFEKGEIDWLGSPFIPLPADPIPFMKDRLCYIPMAASTILTFNTEVFPFNNFKLRKALSLCLDFEEIISTIAPCGQILAARVLPPSLFPEEMPPLFREKDEILARALFEEAIDELQNNLENLVLWIRPNQVEKKLAAALQNQWKKVLGLNIQIEQIDPKTHLERLHTRDYQFAIGSWISQIFDPVNILDRYRLKTNQKNYGGWENIDYQNLLEEAAKELDPKKRLQILADAETLLSSQHHVFPLFHWASPVLINPRLQNIATTPCGGVLFERFSIAQ